MNKSFIKFISSTKTLAILLMLFFVLMFSCLYILYIENRSLYSENKEWNDKYFTEKLRLQACYEMANFGAKVIALRSVGAKKTESKILVSEQKINDFAKIALYNVVDIGYEYMLKDNLALTAAEFSKKIYTECPILLNQYIEFIEKNIDLYKKQDGEKE